MTDAKRELGANQPWMLLDGVEAEVINQTEVPTEAILMELRKNPEIATLTRWASGLASPLTREGGLWERDKYVTPWNIYDQMRIAYDAAESDDIVSGVLEATESMAFGGMAMDCEDMDQEDVWNQVLDDIDLESRIREMWRELFIVSQVTCCSWFVRKSFKVRGKSKGGVQRKKTFNDLYVPAGLSIFDPMKIVPVGNLMFNQEQLCYVAIPGEAQQFERLLSEGLTDDTIVSNLIVGRYEPTAHERVRITAFGLPAEHLYILNPKYVWRHTATRPQYQRFAAVRLRSIFELLDLKQQLKQMDRAHLLGASNFIVLVRKGTDQRPATGPEISALSNQVRTLSKVPIIVGDHRLQIEIITPKLDTTLNGEKYSTLDSRLNARLYQMFCVSDDTEIMTSKGWESYKTLVEGQSQVLTLNRDTGFSEWQSLEAVNVFQQDGPMLSMESKSHSSLSTLNHRWWVNQRVTKEGRRTQEWQWRVSSQLTADSRIPISVPCSDLPQEAKYTDEFVELVAWYICEGSDFSRGGAHISQSEKVNHFKCEKIRLALTSLFGAPNYARDGGLWYSRLRDDGPDRIRMFYLTKEAAMVLRAVASNKTPSPEFLLALTKSQLHLFIDTCIDADGCRSGGMTRFTQHREKGAARLNAFEMACVLAGVPYHRTTAQQMQDQIALVKYEFVNPLAAQRKEGYGKVEEVHYQGDVWCPTVPNGTWLARRNGCVFWTGNTVGSTSHGQGRDDSLKLARVVARGMESRRHMLRRAIERHVFRPMYEMNPELTSPAELTFHPKRIALDFDPAVAAFLQDLRDRGDISRDSILQELDFSQANEARNRERERELYDEIFETQNPWGGTPAGGPPGQQTMNQAGQSNTGGGTGKPLPGRDPKAMGRALGGNRNGGGRAGGALGRGRQKTDQPDTGKPASPKTPPSKQ